MNFRTNFENGKSQILNLGHGDAVPTFFHGKNTAFSINKIHAKMPAFIVQGCLNLKLSFKEILFSILRKIIFAPSTFLITCFVLLDIYAIENYTLI